MADWAVIFKKLWEGGDGNQTRKGDFILHQLTVCSRWLVCFYSSRCLKFQDLCPAEVTAQESKKTFHTFIRRRSCWERCCTWPAAHHRPPATAENQARIIWPPGAKPRKCCCGHSVFVRCQRSSLIMERTRFSAAWLIDWSLLVPLLKYGPMILPLCNM